MTQTEYDVVAGDLMALAMSIETGKRPGYTVGDRDVLANFKKTAERAGIEVGQAWAVFFLKHIDAILSIMTRPDLPQAEEPPGRFADAINYLRLGFAILSERSSAPNVEGSANSPLEVRMLPGGVVTAGTGFITTRPCVRTVGTGSTGE